MNLEATPDEQAAIDAQKQREVEEAARPAAGQPPQRRQRMPLVVRSPLHTRILSFLAVVTGGKVDGETWRERVGACAHCPSHAEVQYRFGVKMYCELCGCPRWGFSELKKACRYKLWTCKLGRHPGQNGAAGDCPGCGGG